MTSILDLSRISPRGQRAKASGVMDRTIDSRSPHGNHHRRFATPAALQHPTAVTAHPVEANPLGRHNRSLPARASCCVYHPAYPGSAMHHSNGVSHQIRLRPSRLLLLAVAGTAVCGPAPAPPTTTTGADSCDRGHRDSRGRPTPKSSLQTAPPCTRSLCARRSPSPKARRLGMRVQVRTSCTGPSRQPPSPAAPQQWKPGPGTRHDIAAQAMSPRPARTFAKASTTFQGHVHGPIECEQHGGLSSQMSTRR